MEKAKKRSFSKLKKSFIEEEFLKFCKKIAEEYANSSGEYARSHFMNKYDISQNCFYKVLETAIVYNLVSEDIVNKMEAKAISNQKSHAILAGVKSHVHYSQMRHKRYQYIISVLSDKRIDEIATEFAYSELSKLEFANKNDMPIGVIDLLLKKAIEEAIVDDIVFYAIRERSIANAKVLKETEEFFKTLLEKRNDKINELLSK